MTHTHRSPLGQAAEERGIVLTQMLIVADIERSVRFYRDVLGATVVDSFLNIRVADIDSVYREWSDRGAQFITEPLNNHGAELRCYLRDPDGYLIEVGQTLSR